MKTKMRIVCGAPSLRVRPDNVVVYTMSHTPVSWARGYITLRHRGESYHASYQDIIDCANSGRNIFCHLRRIEAAGRVKMYESCAYWATLCAVAVNDNCEQALVDYLYDNKDYYTRALAWMRCNADDLHDAILDASIEVARRVVRGNTCIFAPHSYIIESAKKYIYGKRV